MAMLHSKSLIFRVPSPFSDYRGSGRREVC